MAFATSDQTELRYIKETNWGTTPTTGNLTVLRYKGESLNANIETTVSEEIRADRATADLTPVGQSAGGSVDFELSFGAFDDLIEGALFSSFSADLNIVGVAGDITADSAASKFTSTTTTKFDSISVGQWIEVRGFTANSGENNGYYRVVAATPGTGEITVSPAPRSTETPAGTAAEIHGQMLRNGVTPQSFTLQKRFLDATPVTYQNFAGSMVSGMTLSYEVGSILTGSFEFLCKEGLMTTTALPGLTDTPAPSNEVLNAVSNLTDIRVNDTVSSKSFLTLGLEIGNNLRGQKAIGSLANVGVGAGKLDVSGPISVYFQDKTEFDLFSAGTAFSLSFRLQDSAGNAYIFTFPRVKYESLTVAASGQNNDLLAEGQWRAILDPVTSAMVQIDKFVA
jgi:hypothetical protein